ncbi:MAG: hypothetical protein LLF98_02730 [Clostridium sp.]|nr:hypothetical protein [Clostridium sp.]
MLILIFYLLPVIMTYICIKDQYETEWTYINTGKLNKNDWVMVLTPLLNFGYMIFGMFRVFDIFIRQTEK